MKKNKVIFLFHDAEKNNGATHSMMDVIDYLYEKKDIMPILAFPKKKRNSNRVCKEKRISSIHF